MSRLFTEAVHSRAVERYLERLAARLGALYLGTAVKGGTEGTRLAPPRMTARLRGRFYALGKALGETGGFAPEIVKALGRPERLAPGVRLIISAMARLGMIDAYWNGIAEGERRLRTAFRRAVWGIE